MTGRACVVVVVMAGVGCKKSSESQIGKKEDVAASSPKYSGPCAAERAAAAQAWARVGSELESMRDAILKEANNLAYNAKTAEATPVQNSLECRYVWNTPEYNLTAQERPAWKKCNDQLKAINDAAEQLRRDGYDVAGLKAKAKSAAADARAMAERYRQGPVPTADAKQLLDRVMAYYGGASRVQVVGDHCLGNDCLSTPAASRTVYDIKPLQTSLAVTEAACPKVNGGAAPPAPPPTSSPPTAGATATQTQATEDCKTKLVLDPDPKENGANLRVDPNGDVIVAIPNCTEVCAMSEKDNWVQVRASPRDVGYIHKSMLVDPGHARCKAP